MRLSKTKIYRVIKLNKLKFYKLFITQKMLAIRTKCQTANATQSKQNIKFRYI